jgi:hypothetical protein
MCRPQKAVVLVERVAASESDDEYPIVDPR